MSGKLVTLEPRNSPAFHINRMMRDHETPVLKQAATVLRSDLDRHKRGIRHVRHDHIVDRMLALELLNDIGNLIAEEIARREAGGGT
jgi:hypothetical protein